MSASACIPPGRPRGRRRWCPPDTGPAPRPRPSPGPRSGPPPAGPGPAPGWRSTPATVRRREADAGAGRSLVPDRPVGAAQIHLGAGRGIGHHAGLHGVRERPVHLHTGRRIAVENESPHAMRTGKSSAGTRRTSSLRAATGAGLPVCGPGLLPCRWELRRLGMVLVTG